MGCSLAKKGQFGVIIRVLKKGQFGVVIRVVNKGQFGVVIRVVSRGSLNGGGGGDWLLPKDLSCFVSENGFVVSKKSRKSQGIFFPDHW